MHRNVEQKEQSWTEIRQEEMRGLRRKECIGMQLEMGGNQNDGKGGMERV